MGDEDLKKLKWKQKLGYIASGIIATAFAYEYIMAESSYKSYQNATNSIDAQNYRDQSEMFISLQNSTAIILGISAGLSIYTTINLEGLKKKLSLN